VLLHAALLAALLLAGRMRPNTPEWLPAPAFDVVYEGGQPERPEAEPPPGEVAPPAMPEAPAAAPAPPAPVAEIPPQPPPSAEAPPETAAPEQAPPPPVAESPPPPEPPPSAEAPPAPAAAAQTPPPADLPPLPDLADILPPARELRLRVPQAPRPPPPPAPDFSAGTVFLPAAPQLARPAPPPGRPQGRGLDLTVDPRLAEGRAAADPNVRVTGAAIGADWRAAFRAWLDQNIRYPRRAAELGESGTVRVRVRTAPDGTVTDVRLVGPSGSPSLNLATTAPFAGARLPPFPPPVDPEGATVELTVHYILRGR
jgi:TonB family protein